MRFLNSRTLRYFGQRARELAHNFENAHHPYEERQGGRSWEDYYRRRWQHDKVVRSTHGVNCTGSCSFDVFVKDGIIVWEAQKTDYPTPHPVFPGIPCLSATAFRAAVALSLPLASPVRPYSGACRNGKRENRSSAFPEKQGRQGLLAGKLSRIFLMKRKKGMHPKLGIQHFFARKLFLS